MLLNPSRSVAFVFLLLALASCKNLMETPLLGTGKPANAATLSGAWKSIGAQEQVMFEIEPQGDEGWYAFSFQENSKHVTGRLSVGYLEDRLILNIDLKSLAAEGSEVFNLSAARFLMVGAIFLEGKLIIAPVNMEVFEERMAAYLDAAPKDFSGNCGPLKEDKPTANNFCHRFWSSVKVITLTESEAFHRAFLSNYDDIFPIDDAVTFAREN